MEQRQIQQPPHQKRVVSFDSEVTTVPILHTKDYTNEEFKASFYEQDDMFRFTIEAKDQECVADDASWLQNSLAVSDNINYALAVKLIQAFLDQLFRALIEWMFAAFYR